MIWKLWDWSSSAYVRGTWMVCTYFLSIRSSPRGCCHQSHNRFGLLHSNRHSSPSCTPHRRRWGFFHGSGTPQPYLSRVRPRRSLSRLSEGSCGCDGSQTWGATSALSSPAARRSGGNVMVWVCVGSHITVCACVCVWGVQPPSLWALVLDNYLMWCHEIQAVMLRVKHECMFIARPIPLLDSDISIYIILLFYSCLIFLASHSVHNLHQWHRC